MALFTVAVIGNLCVTNREITVPSVPTTMVCVIVVTINKPPQTAQGATMDFNGAWKVFHQENLENFLQAMGWFSFYLVYIYIYINVNLYFL